MQAHRYEARPLCAQLGERGAYYLPSMWSHRHTGSERWISMSWVTEVTTRDRMELKDKVQVCFMTTCCPQGCYWRFSDMPRSWVTPKERWKSHIGLKDEEHCRWGQKYTSRLGGIYIYTHIHIKNSQTNLYFVGRLFKKFWAWTLVCSS